jgi:hypothetical protein
VSVKVTKDTWKSLPKEERDNYLCTFVSTMWDNHIRQTDPDRARWAVANALFRGEMDWGPLREEQKWRSKPFVHQFAPLCRRVAEASQDLVFGQPDFFSILPLQETDKEFARIREKLVRYYLDILKLENFFYDYALTGAIHGVGIWKLVADIKAMWKPEVVVQEIKKQLENDTKKVPKTVSTPLYSVPQDPEAAGAELERALAELIPVVKPRRAIEPKKVLELRFRLANVLPINWGYEDGCVNLSETPYTIEQIFKKKFELAPYFEAGTFDESVRSKITETTTSGGSGRLDSEEEQTLAFKEQLNQTNRYAPKVEMLEYYGPLLDETGDILEECRHIVIANRKHLLRYARNPFYKQQPPYGASVFSKVPGKAVGQGIADGATDSQIILNNMFALFVDLCELAVSGLNVVDTTGLDDPSELDDGFYPGQTLKGNKDAKEIFSRVPFDTNMAPQMFQLFEFLNLNGQKASGVDTSSANPSSRARITGTEIESNSARTSQSLFALGRELDATFIEPLIQLLDSYCLQFALSDNNLSDLAFKGVLTDAEYQLLNGISEIDRFREIQRPVQVVIKGFRERIERNEFLSRIIEVYNIISKDPNAPTILNMKEFYSYMLELFNLPTDRLVISDTPQDKAREENAILERGQSVSISEQDDHMLELPEHYAAAMRGGQPVVLQHILQHVQAIGAQGGQPPMPPPEVEQMIQQMLGQDQEQIAGPEQQEPAMVQ